MRLPLISFLMALMVLPLWLGGCAPKVGQGDYGSSRVGEAQRVRYGTVVSQRVVTIEDDSNTSTTVGTLGGGVAGGVLGSLIGGGSGRVVGAVAGAALGAAAGYGGAKALTTQKGYEITVKLDNGEVFAVTQGADMSFHQGQRVKVISGSSGTRVTTP